MFLAINLAAKLLTNLGLSLSEFGSLSVTLWYPQEPKDETWNQTGYFYRRSCPHVI